ncbi:MAG: hypothetical protein CMJ58_23475 [Planctomycetaceae bacterium]|nr:hypothetical protein [Planctomycetaceae bacterium]
MSSKARIALVYFLLGFLLYAPSARAANALATLDIRAEQFAEDPTGRFLYASEFRTHKIFRIDLQTLQIDQTFYGGQGPAGMTFSTDGRLMYVANIFSTTVSVVDVATHTLVNQIDLPTNAYDLELGAGGQLYVTPVGSLGSIRTDIMQVDTTTGQYVGDFARPLGSIGDWGLLQISPDRKTLYSGNTGSSLGTVVAYDVSDGTPTLIWTNERTNLLNSYQTVELGGPGSDLELSRDGKWLTYLAGGGNDANGKDNHVAIIDTATFEIVDDFGYGPPVRAPSEGTFSPDNAVYYAVHSESRIYMHVLDRDAYLAAPLFEQVSGFATPGGPNSSTVELYVDPSGRHLFAATSRGLLVFDTGRQVIPEPSAVVLAAIALLGSGLRMGKGRATTCRTWHGSSSDTRP